MLYVSGERQVIYRRCDINGMNDTVEFLLELNLFTCNYM